MKENRQKLDVQKVDIQELIRHVETQGLLKAPVHMKQEILERSRRVDYQLAVQGRELSKNMQLFFYSLKVGAAMVTALFMLFAVPRELPWLERQTESQFQAQNWQDADGWWQDANEQRQDANEQWQDTEVSLGTRVNAGLGEVDRMLTAFVRGEYNRN